MGAYIEEISGNGEISSRYPAEKTYFRWNPQNSSVDKWYGKETRGSKILVSIQFHQRRKIKMCKCSHFFSAFMEFQIKDNLKLGKIIIELYNDYVPLTVQNFLSLCRGENGLSYKNCLIHNIVRGKYIETGDITKGNGKGGVSIYGEDFDQENFDLKHTRAGFKG